ncbi:sensor histidine kinase [Massilia sp. MB5]|uniref:sensor histidine kinase n=1 Tax=Massilia sp. MB5 TaxID=2919578 RepID=UPI0027D9625A|nr:sensor histidine kinase [Massilia sp. MB5]
MPPSPILRLLRSAAFLLASRLAWRLSKPEPAPVARQRLAGRRATDYALEAIREEERAHIARELHDDLGQLLAALRVDMDLLQQQDAREPGARQRLHSMDQLLLSAITSLRRIAGNLRPRALDEGGLYFALQSLRHDWVQRHGIACHLQAAEAELILDDHLSTAVFRIVQESLTNIARHAHAHTVELQLHRKDGALLIAIEDDGRGIGESDLDKPTSYGLLGMRERVLALRGDLAISGSPGQGTRIDIRLPLPSFAEP